MEAQPSESPSSPAFTTTLPLPPAEVQARPGAHPAAPPSAPLATSPSPGDAPDSSPCTCDREVRRHLGAPAKARPHSRGQAGSLQNDTCLVGGRRRGAELRAGGGSQRRAPFATSRHLTARRPAPSPHTARTHQLQGSQEGKGLLQRPERARRGQLWTGQTRERKREGEEGAEAPIGTAAPSPPQPRSALPDSRGPSLARARSSPSQMKFWGRRRVVLGATNPASGSAAGGARLGACRRRGGGGERARRGLATAPPAVRSAELRARAASRGRGAAGRGQGGGEAAGGGSAGGGPPLASCLREGERGAGEAESPAPLLPRGARPPAALGPRGNFGAGARGRRAGSVGGTGSHTEDGGSR